MDTTNWQKIKLGDLFEIYTSSNKNYLESEDGNVPYISSTRFNNGVSSFVQAETIQNKNTITVARNGSVGSAFYHSYNYCASPDDIRIFKPKFKINKYIALFLCTLIEKEKFRFAYGRKFGTKRMQITTIKLPMQKNNTIDWQWIEDYVKNTLVPKLPQKSKSVWNNNFDKQSVLDKKLELNIENWKWFRYDEIFEIKKGKRLTKADQIDGDIPYISSSSVNNAVDNYIGNGYTDENCISFACYGSIGEVFYQAGKVWISDNANSIYLKNRKLNKYIAFFLLTLLYKEIYRFSYGMTAKKERLENFIIKLPITPNHAPDWQFMEDYIKSLNHSKSI